MLPDSPPKSKGLLKTLEVTSTVLVMAASLLVIVGAVRYLNTPEVRRSDSKRPPIAVPKEPLLLREQVPTGKVVPTVVMVEYSDFQCPFCGQFARDVLPEVVRSYVQTGKLLVAFRYLPLRQIHPLALDAATAAECASRQGKFWEMHDALFADQQHLDKKSILREASSIGLDATHFQNCISGEQPAEIAADLAEASRLGLTGTPVFMFGRTSDGKKVQVTDVASGLQSVAAIKSTLDRLITQ